MVEGVIKTYELLVKLYKDLDYKRYTIKDLKEMREILKQFEGETFEIRLERLDKGKLYMKERTK